MKVTILAPAGAFTDPAQAVKTLSFTLLPTAVVRLGQANDICMDGRIHVVFDTAEAAQTEFVKFTEARIADNKSYEFCTGVARLSIAADPCKRRLLNLRKHSKHLAKAIRSICDWFTSLTQPHKQLLPKPRARQRQRRNRVRSV